MIKIVLVSALIILAVVSAVDYLTGFYRLSFPWERSNLISSDVEIHFGMPVEVYDWRPDDSRILYKFEAELGTMKPDGSNKVRLYPLEIEEMIDVTGLQYASDGKRLAFTREVTEYFMEDTNVTKPPVLLTNICVINTDGTNLVKLTSDNVSSQPSWSPDGERIVFVKASDIWVINSDGSGLRQLTSMPGGEGQPIWSPDGKRIAFVNQRTVYIMNSDRSGTTAVPSVPEPTYGWSWGPDSSVIVASDGEDIWAFTIDGRVVRRLIATMEDDWNPRVSHDGQKIVYETLQPRSFGVMNLRVATLSKPLCHENLAECSSAMPTPSLPWPFITIGGVIVHSYLGVVFVIVIFGILMVKDKLVKRAAGKKHEK